MGSTNFVKSLWLPDIQIYKCKQFKKRQIVTDVAGKTNFNFLTTNFMVQLEYTIHNFERRQWGIGLICY